jgi:hypothetical protein
LLKGAFPFAPGEPSPGSFLTTQAKPKLLAMTFAKYVPKIYVARLRLDEISGFPVKKL